MYPLDSLLPTKIIVTLPFEIVIFLKKELTIIFVSQLLFSFQGTSLSVLFRALKIEQYLLCLYLVIGSKFVLYKRNEQKPKIELVKKAKK